MFLDLLIILVSTSLYISKRKISKKTRLFLQVQTQTLFKYQDRKNLNPDFLLPFEVFKTSFV